MTKLPSAFVVLPFALVSMLMIIAFAFVADCVRLDNAASDVVKVADQDLLAFELRMVQLLKTSSTLSGETREAIKDYDSATVSTKRHAAFLHLVQTFESSAADNQLSVMGLNDSAINANPESNEASEDATNMRAARRFVDEVRGIANRWSVSMQSYKTQADKLNQFRQSRQRWRHEWLDLRE